MSEGNLHEVVRRIDPEARLLRTWSLTGGVSAAVTAIEFGRPGEETVMAIVRRHGAVDLARNPHVARDEFALLEIVRRHGVAAPGPLIYDDSCQALPTPYVVVAFVEGTTEFAPGDLNRYVEQSAEQLAVIHRMTRSAGLGFLPDVDRRFGESPAVLDTTMGEERIRHAMAAASQPARNESRLLHGDFWPGNLLWRDRRLVAVIDWEDAAVGDPLADLANARLEFLWWFGREAMMALTERYREATEVDTGELPYWDLCAALRPCSRLSSWGLDEATERRVRERHAEFVEEAIRALAVRRRSARCSRKGVMGEKRGSNRGM